ncbi:hypothetical protein [Rothia nasimurium]|uniref:hypothetical protein n=1 Tax=Rothia nasimurium TaxID=85336 RepID=UPI003BA2C329
MSENPYTPNPNLGAPQPGAQPTGPAGTYPAPNQPYGDPYATLQQPDGKKPKNIVGLVALGLGIVGFILACIPGIMFLGWLLLFAAFVTGIVGLFQKGKEKISSIVALILSVVGSIVSTIVLVVFVANTVATDPEFEKAMQDLESALATPSAVTSVESGASAPESAAETPAADAGSASAVEGVLKFGDTAEYSDGLRMTLSEPRTDFVPSEYTARLDESLTNYVAFTVTIENGTSEPFEPLFYAEGNSGGKAVDQIFDADQNIGSGPSGRILPGESVTFDVAFGVADPASVTLDVSADFDHDPVLYSNK